MKMKEFSFMKVVCEKKGKLVSRSEFKKRFGFYVNGAVFI